MGLYEKIETDAKRALKEGDAARLSVLRMLLSAIKTFELEKQGGAVEEADVLEIIKRHIKQHKESIEQFAKGKRQDLVDKETKELKILEAYMPKQLEEAQVLNIIKETIQETGFTTKADVGKVMKLVMAKVKGNADGKLVNNLVMGLLK